MDQSASLVLQAAANWCENGEGVHFWVSFHTHTLEIPFCIKNSNPEKIQAQC